MDGVGQEENEQHTGSISTNFFMNLIRKKFKLPIQRWKTVHSNTESHDPSNLTSNAAGAMLTSAVLGCQLSSGNQVSPLLTATTHNQDRSKGEHQLHQTSSTFGRSRSGSSSASRVFGGGGISRSRSGSGSGGTISPNIDLISDHAELCPKGTPSSCGLF
jgi:hypothetical protein